MIEVICAAIVRGNKLFIAQRKAGIKLEGLWELPGGKIEIGETPQECIVREMHEEFGIEISAHEYLGENIHEYSYGRIKLVAYTCHWLSGSMNLLEHDDIAWVDSSNIGEFELAPADIPLVEGILERLELASRGALVD